MLKKMNELYMLSLKYDGSLHKSYMLGNVLRSGEVYMSHQLPGEEIRMPDGVWNPVHPILGLYHENKWYNINIVLEENDDKIAYFYCNIATPIIHLGSSCVCSIDLDLDIWINPDYSYSIKDRDEFENNKERYNYSLEVISYAEETLSELENLIRFNKPPFQDDFVRELIECVTRENVRPGKALSRYLNLPTK